MSPPTRFALFTVGSYIDFKIPEENKSGDIKDDVNAQRKAKSFGVGINIGGGVELITHFTGWGKLWSGLD